MVDNSSAKKYPIEWNYLQAGTIIDEYMIERRLAKGGFSTVYLARQLADQHQVVIKEYLPLRFAHRTEQNCVVPNSDDTKARFMRGRQLFIEEAKVLANLKHPNIVEVVNFFHCNSTVYMVMTFDYGKNLAYYLRNKKGRLSYQFLMIVFSTLLDGLKTIHNHNFLHLDIKPGNILIRPGGDPLLLDFGAVHPYPSVGERKPGKILTNGFSPMEQYPKDGDLGPWSDIYAIGATMRTCISGQPPPPAPERETKDTLVPAMKPFKNSYPNALLETIDSALEMNLSNRPQTAEEFLNLLSSS